MDLIYGIDIGDGETVSSFLKFDKIDLTDKKHIINHIDSRMSIFWKNQEGQVSFNQLIDSNKLFCNFKREPSTLSDKEFSDFVSIMLDYCNLYYSEVILNHIDQNTKAQQIKKIVFCIGHPTNWLANDIKKYKEILLKTKFGQNKICINNQEIDCLFLLEKESRAAFLHYQNDLHDFVKMKNRLLIDIGSSTIDITAVSGTSNLSIYNSGNNFLGARIIDYTLLEYVLHNIISKKVPDKLHIFELNELSNKKLLISCRKAKEKLFDALKNNKVITAKIEDNNIDGRIAISLEDFSRVLNTKTKSVIQKYNLSPQNTFQFIDDISWEELFKKFLTEEKIKLDEMKFNIEEIIFSGSASLMSFIPNACEEVFGKEVKVQYDHSPGIAIANGLVLCVISNAKSNSFKNQAYELLQENTPKVIENHLSDFSEIISSVISDYISDKTYIELLNWKDGSTRTLKEVKEKLIKKCDASSIMNQFNNTNIQNKINIWYSSVFDELNAELQLLIKKNNVEFYFSKEYFSMPAISIPITVESSISEFANEIIETSINGIFASGETLIGSMFAFVLQAIVLTLEILIEIFGAIIAIILIPLGIDLKLPSEVLTGKMLTVNFPAAIRKRIKNEDLKKASMSGNEQIKIQIELSVKDNKFKKDLVNNISESLKNELKKVIKEIQYIIERRVVIDIEDKTVAQNTNDFFLMPIRNIFRYSGRGIAVIGVIEQGAIKKNDAIEIAGLRNTQKSVVVDIEISNKSVQEAFEGNEVTIFLRSICSYDIEIGQVLITPDSIKPNKKFEAEIYVLTEAEIGQSVRIFNNFCSLFHFNTIDIEGKIVLQNGITILNSGTRANVICELNRFFVLKNKQKFSVKDKNTEIAYGKIIRFID